ncbi:MAG: hypothetical protein R3E58_13500 [Phycisphaerae bacterium]
MLIPLILLAGRATISRCMSLRSPFAIVLFVGAVLNSFLHISCTHDTERDGERFNLEGATHAFTDGLLDSERMSVTSIPSCRLTRMCCWSAMAAFYFQRAGDYCVVFNRNPFAEAVEDASSPEAVSDWLRKRGYTHVLVHYSEMQRLRGSYGFWESITPSLFEQLVDAGLKGVAQFGE